MQDELAIDMNNVIDCIERYIGQNTTKMLVIRVDQYPFRAFTPRELARVTEHFKLRPCALEMMPNHIGVVCHNASREHDQVQWV